MTARLKRPHPGLRRALIADKGSLAPERQLGPAYVPALHPSDERVAVGTHVAASRMSSVAIPPMPPSG